VSHTGRGYRRLLGDRLKENVDEMSATFGIQIIQQGPDRDHILIQFFSRPSIAPLGSSIGLKAVILS
jgi:hypothetical protein